MTALELDGFDAVASRECKQSAIRHIACEVYRGLAPLRWLADCDGNPLTDSVRLCGVWCVLISVLLFLDLKYCNLWLKTGLRCLRSAPAAWCHAVGSCS